MPHIFHSGHGELVGKTGARNGDTVPRTGESLGLLHTATVQIIALLPPAQLIQQYVPGNFS